AARSSVVGIQSQPVEPTKRFRSGVSISIIHELQKLTLCGPPRAADQPACFRGRSFHVACNFDLASPSRWYVVRALAPVACGFGTVDGRHLCLPILRTDTRVFGAGASEA